MNNPYPMSAVRAEDTATDLKCVVARPVLRYLEHLLGANQMQEIITSTRMHLPYLENGNNWISFDYYCRLLERLVEATGDSHAPYTASRNYTNRQTYSTVESFLTRLASPVTTYRFLARFHGLWDRYAEWKLLAAGLDHCTIAVSFRRFKQNKNNCLALQGSLASVPAFFGLPFATVAHYTCMCDGAEACVYEMNWVNKPEAKTALLGTLTGLLIGSALVLLFKTTHAVWIVVPALAAAGYFAGRTSDYIKRLGEVYVSNENQSQALLEAMMSLEELNHSLQNQIELRTSELSTSNRALQQAMQELRQSQKRMLEVQRQAAIGALAAGTAHEMNSPLNGVRLSLQALKEEAADQPVLLKMIENADRASFRCARIVRELLAFSRSPQQLAQLNLPDIVRACLNIFRKENPVSAFIREDIDGNLPTLFLDRAQIQQALLNLLTNANDAMKGDGTITVSIRNEGSHITLSIADSGPGIAPERLEHIFDPFFSTKIHDGKGLGLGLSITYELITRNGGTIEAESEPGRGTCFTICFPAHMNTTPKDVAPTGKDTRP